MGFFQATSGTAAGYRTSGCCLQFLQLPFLLRVLHPLPYRRIPTRFRSCGDSRGHGIQVDIGTRHQQRLLIQNRDGLVAAFPKGAFAIVFLVGHPSQRFLQ